MAKKNFSGGLNSLLGDTPSSAKAEPGNATSAVEPTKQVAATAEDNEVRATFIVQDTVLEKLKAIAYWDRLLIKEVIGSALKDYIDQYEKANGKIKPVPKK